MDTSPESFLSRFKQVRKQMLDMVWPDGRNPDAPSDGEHYTLRSFPRPVSVSATEAFILANICILGDPATVFEIGTGFGYSTAWFAIGLALSGRDGRIVTIDNNSEGQLGDRGSTTARRIAAMLQVESRIEFIRGESPRDVARAIGTRPIDIAFIDADHHGERPAGDYRAIRPHLHRNSLILFHDVDSSRYSVPDAIAAAQADGWSSRTLSTSCFITAVYQDNSWESRIDIAYEAALRRELSSKREIK